MQEKQNSIRHSVVLVVRHVHVASVAGEKRPHNLRLGCVAVTVTSGWVLP